MSVLREVFRGTIFSEATDRVGLKFESVELKSALDVPEEGRGWADMVARLGSRRLYPWY
jgi:hypothetical protein